MGSPRVAGIRGVTTGLPIAGRGGRNCIDLDSGPDLGGGQDSDRESGNCGRGDWSAEMALSARAVVSPRLPILMPDEPYLYIQPGPQPPSSHCSGSNSA